MKTSTHVDQALIFSLFEDMIKYKINYGYRGLFTSTVSDGLIKFAQSIFNVSGISKKTKKRAFYILVECVQNITRHQCAARIHHHRPICIAICPMSGRRFFCHATDSIIW